MTKPTRSACSTFSAEIASLHAMLSWVRKELEESHFSDPELKRIEIALEEALVNIIQYAYVGKKGVIEMTFSDYLPDHVEIIIKDYGIPFNPLENRKKVDPSASLEERSIGGLGIVFIEKLMDHMEYIREGEANVLTLKKKSPTQHL